MSSSSFRTLSSCSKLASTGTFARRAAQAAASRTYATAASSSSSPQAADYSVTSSSSGIKVASLDEGSPTSAITVAVKAGPRYEPSPGLAHVLKNFVFKSTSKRSALRITRETELLGGVLSASLSREHLFLTAECLRGDEPYFAEILGDAITQSQFKAHEYLEEVVPAVAAEYEAASHNASVLAMDFAHQLAFRRGLGNSLFASPFLEVDAQSAIAFGRSSFANTNGIAVLSNSSLSSSTLKDLVGEFYTGVQAPASSSSPAANLTSTEKAKYYGGETRVPMTGHGHGSTGHFLLALQGGSTSAPEYAVLKALLGGEAATKWGVGTQPFAKLSNVSTYVPSVRAVNLQYSDTGLFGFTVDAKTGEIASLAKQAVAAIREVADKGVKDEEFKRAVAKAKFEAATSLEGRVTKQEIIGAQILESGKITSLSDAFKALESVSPSKVQEAAKAALKSKPTTVAVGDTHKLPYADELGL